MAAVMRLQRGEIDFMLRNLGLPGTLRDKLEQAKQGGARLSSSEADTLRDLCGDRMQSHGFDSDMELTEEGQRLESLLDRLFLL